MPYNRDQVIAAVTDYYDFLARLHLDPEDIRRPPPEGWPQISRDRLSPVGSTDEVVSLLKHLPYVQNDDNSTPIRVWTYSGCSDYSGRDFLTTVDQGFPHRMSPEDYETGPESYTWEKMHKPHA